MGARTRFFSLRASGAIPQDKKYQGEDSSLAIGDRNTIREFATLNIGTTGGGMVTRIGHDNLFMVYSHVGHDCQIGNNVILANCATLAGHVILEDYVGVGGWLPSISLRVLGSRLTLVGERWSPLTFHRTAWPREIGLVYLV